jgi:hypothetical protein
MKYTYSDDEDEGYSDATTSRRSTRNTGTHTPAEGPTVTLSGRQVKSRQGGTYGESMLSGAQVPVEAVESFGTSEEPEGGGDSDGRPRRAAAAKTASNGWATTKAHIEGYNSVDEMDSDEDDASEQDYGDDEEEDEHISLESDVEDPDDLPDVDENLSDVADEDLQSFLVKLPVKTPTPERNVLVKQRITPEPTTITDDRPKDPAEFTSTSKEPSLSTQISTNPITIPPQQTPLSPLAFRGSPEKSRPFHPSIDVGYGGA